MMQKLMLWKLGKWNSWYMWLLGPTYVLVQIYFLLAILSAIHTIQLAECKARELWMEVLIGSATTGYSCVKECPPCAAVYFFTRDKKSVVYAPV